MLSYQSGYNTLNDINLEIGSIILVKGKETRTLVGSLFEHYVVYEIESPPFNELSNTFNHICCPILTHSTTYCACLKVYKLYAYLYL